MEGDLPVEAERLKARMWQDIDDASGWDNQQDWGDDDGEDGMLLFEPDGDGGGAGRGGGGGQGGRSQVRIYKGLLLRNVPIAA